MNIVYFYDSTPYEVIFTKTLTFNFEMNCKEKLSKPNFALKHDSILPKAITFDLMTQNKLA